MNSLIILATAIYAITGGPSTGKTSIVEQLKKDGHATAEEAATCHILNCQANGDMKPWLESGFQTNIFTLQTALENKALEANPETLFVDRGFLDSLVYLEHNNEKDSDEYAHIENKLQDLDIENYYAAVFFIEPHNENEFVLEKNIVRRESTEEAHQIAYALKRAYSKYYNVISIPGNLTIKERADLIISKVKEMSNKPLATLAAALAQQQEPAKEKSFFKKLIELPGKTLKSVMDLFTKKKKA
jgi:predicted ATPase